MDMTTMYPEGIKPILLDSEVEELESYYNKSIARITDFEIRDWEQLMEAIAFDRSFGI